MAALYSIWKRLSHLRLDGVHYDICGKEREDGRFTVAWVCLLCCEQGPPIPAAETSEQAVSFAYIGLRAHHELVHSKLGDTLADDGRATPSCDRSQDGSGMQPGRVAAFKQLRVTFEKLCSANAKLHSCKGHGTESNSASKEIAAACLDWNQSACDFDAALEAYSME